MLKDITLKMIQYSKGNIKDIDHFMKVYSYADMICIGENINKELKELILITALIHDISVPYCRTKYGNSNGKYQETESEPLVREFLKEFSLDKEI